MMKTIILKNQRSEIGNQRSVLILLVLCGFALSPVAQATPQVVPPPDGCYPGFTTAEGCNALQSLTTGAGNTGFGWRSLFSAGASNFNTGVGAGTLLLNTGDSNTAVGAAALLLNTSGIENSAVGADALVHNDSGSSNNAFGAFALFSNTTGSGNTANGHQALFSNVDGNSNTAVGRVALTDHTTGSFNTAIGNQALEADISGLRNTAVGSFALGANTTGNDNTAVGRHAGDVVTGNGNVCIGESVSGEAGVDDRTYIRNVNTFTQNFSAGVNNYVTVRLTDGRLGNTAVVSSQRYKQDIKPLDTASQALYALKPVSFRLKKEYDETQALGFGLIAEEVEKVDPALVYRNNKGQAESVRYEMVNAMLLNEFLKEHKKVEELQATVAQQQKAMESLMAQIQKVSAQVELNKPATRTVAIGQ